MSYLQGSGTEIDPYVVATFDHVKSMFGADFYTSAIFEIVADIDGGGINIPRNKYSDSNITINGNGHRLSNFTLGASGQRFCGTGRTKFKELTIDFAMASGCRFAYYNRAVVTDCIVSKVGPLDKSEGENGSGAVLTRSFFTVAISYYGSQTDCYSYAPGNVGTTPANPYAASSYPQLAAYPDIWLLDNASLPRLVDQDTSLLTMIYAIMGTTKVGGVAKSRIVGGHSPVDFHQFAKIISDPVDGSYLLDCGYYTDHVAVVHRDDYGKPFVASKAYALGERIHPSTPNGYAYECTSAGTSDSAAPTDWPTTGTLTSGTAIFTPKPIYAPETLLVVPVLYNLLTGEPVEV